MCNADGVGDGIFFFSSFHITFLSFNPAKNICLLKMYRIQNS